MGINLKKEIEAELNCLGDAEPLKLIIYDEMLSPYAYHKFENTIPRAVWDRLRARAKENLEKNPVTVNQEVIKHWKQIDLGFIPFGYILESEF